MSSTEPASTTTPPAAPTLVQKLAAEALGTFALVFVGLGAITLVIAQQLQRYVGDEYSPDLEDLLSGNGFVLALAFGFTLVALTYAFHRVSGAHLNPAVSIGAALAGRLAWVEAAMYAGAQVVGGLLGGAVVLVVANGFEIFDSFTFPLAPNGFGDDFVLGATASLWAVLLIEVVATLLFTLVFLASTDDRNPSPVLAPLAIGFAFAGIYFATGSVDGGGSNPARSLASAVFSGTDVLKQAWLFVIAPLVGGAIAGVVYPLVFGRSGTPVAGVRSELRVQAGGGRRRLRSAGPAPAAVGPAGGRVRSRRGLRSAGGVQPAGDAGAAERWSAGTRRAAGSGAAARRAADHPGRLAVGPADAAVDPRPAAAAVRRPGWLGRAGRGRADPGASARRPLIRGRCRGPTPSAARPHRCRSRSTRGRHRARSARR
jgi:aquaporin Z